jgi:hypothetical protein
MLIVVNGAQKSGSTWLMHIVLALRPLHGIPLDCRSPRAVPEAIHELHAPQLPALLHAAQHAPHDLLAKSHLRRLTERRLLLAAPFVRVVDIERDIRDVAVSFYHHHRKLELVNGDPADFYWHGGRELIWQILQHRVVWKVSSPRFCLLSYERLQQDFATEVRRLAAFLTVEIDESRIAAVQAATTPQAINSRFAWGHMNRFRSGRSGEWRESLDQAVLNDLMQLQRRSRSLAVRLALTGPAPLRNRLRAFARPPRTTDRS